MGVFRFKWGRTSRIYHCYLTFKPKVKDFLTQSSFVASILYNLHMQHEIYATTFYGPLCLFGKKYEHKCIGPIYNECMKFGCGPFKGCQIYLTVL